MFPCNSLFFLIDIFDFRFYILLIFFYKYYEDKF